MQTVGQWLIIPIVRYIAKMGRELTIQGTAQLHQLKTSGKKTLCNNVHIVWLKSTVTMRRNTIAVHDCVSWLFPLKCWTLEHENKMSVCMTVVEQQREWKRLLQVSIFRVVLILVQINMMVCKWWIWDSVTDMFCKHRNGMLKNLLQSAKPIFSLFIFVFLPAWIGQFWHMANLQS